jgi:hypothetical protein
MESRFWPSASSPATATGDSKPITPEGTVGRYISPDGRSIGVLGPDGSRGVWSIEGNSYRPIPNWERKNTINGWTPDGASVYATENQLRNPTANIYRVNVTTGKSEFWKTFGGVPHFSADGSAYYYVYEETLSQAFVVRGLK